MSIIELYKYTHIYRHTILEEYFYLNTTSIQEMHVEIGNLCNAACPMCARNNQGYGLTDNPGWGAWKKGDEKIVFSKDLPNLKKVYFCGTHGDPLAAPFLFEAVKECKDRGILVEIFTNGSLRSPSWWNKLTSLLTSKDKIIFGIDGILTNHLYRQNTDIKKILKNLSICCSSEVTTRWDFLAFKHNELELTNCQKLAKEMGVNEFRIRKTARFNDDSHPVRNDKGDITHYLAPPDNIELRHPNYLTIQTITKKLPDQYLISCLYKEAKKIYVNSRLEVFPCCYISDDNELMFLNKSKSNLHIPLDQINLRNNTWINILNLPFYKEELIKSFTNSSTLTRCIKTCGVIKREQNQNQLINLYE